MAKNGNKGLTYAQAGVDIEAGDTMVQMIKHHVARTFGPRVLGKYGSFAGCFRLDFNEKLFKRNYRDPVLVACTDGVGTKVKLAAEMGVYDTVGQDLVAMSVNDLVVQGAEPLFFLDYLAVHKLDPKITTQMVKGVSDGCVLAQCALLGGETAEMPDVYQPGEFDMAGFAVGVCELKRLVEGERVEPGDVIIGLASSGIHSNGYALVRAIVKRAKLRLDGVYQELGEDRTLGQILLEPTRIYSRSVVSVLRRYRVKQPITGMSHITGGGIEGNICRALDERVNAKIDLGSWQAPPVFRFLQQHGDVADEEMFNVFNMGLGYAMIVRPHFAESILEQLTKTGEQAFVAGKIVKGSGKVLLSS